jgi:hypothetical protein
MMMLRKSVVVLVAASAISSVSAAAHADTVALTVIDLNQAVTPVTYTASAASGATSIGTNGAQTLGDFQYNVYDVALLGSAAYSFASPALTYTESSVRNTGSSTDTLELVLSATGFNLQSEGSYNGVQISQSDGGTYEGGSFNATLQTFADSANTLYTTVPLAGGTTAATSVSTGAYSNPSTTLMKYTLSTATAGQLVTAGNPFSITSVLEITLAPGQSISLTNNGRSSMMATSVSTNTTPEPSVLPLLAAGVVGLGLLGRKRVGLMRYSVA